MKPLNMCYFGVFILFLTIAFAAGCTGAVKKSPTSPSMEPAIPIPSTSLVGVSPSPNTTIKSCPIPKLIFNNSQKITNLKNTPGIRFTGRNTPQDSRPGTIPWGGVVYYDAGFTRIFDSAGTQILFVNDSESVSPIPAGFVVPSTYIVDAMTVGVISPSPENNASYVYQAGDDTCVAAIIRTPGAFKPPAIPPH